MLGAECGFCSWFNPTRGARAGRTGNDLERKFLFGFSGYSGRLANRCAGYRSPRPFTSPKPLGERRRGYLQNACQTIRITDMLLKSMGVKFTKNC